MASTVELKLILAGHYAGRTVTLRGHRFVNGELTIRGDDVAVQKLSDYLGKCYQAFPENSDKLKAAQERDAAAGKPVQKTARQEDSDGERNATTSQEPGDNDQVQGDEHQPDGSGPQAASADDGSGTDQDPSGEAGSVPDGDGHPDPGIPVAPGTSQPTRIGEALTHLDPNNDEHWRTDGKPRLDAVQEFFGSADLSRTAVEAVAPDFCRTNPTLPA